MADLRQAVDDQLGVERPVALDIAPDDCERFSDDLRMDLSEEQCTELRGRAEALHPWLQGPFWLGGNVVAGGTWRNDLRWVGLRDHIPALTGRRVLDVGSNAGYDAFMFRKLGASDVMACEPFDFIEQARFLEEIYRSGARFVRLGWQDLDPRVHGTFDLVHCHGLLYHEPLPIAMIERLRSMVAEGGTLLLGSMMLGSPEHSEYARLVPGSYYGDPTWWWVPGRHSLRWMMESAGLLVLEEFGLSPGPPGEFEVVNGYFKTVAAPTSA